MTLGSVPVSILSSMWSCQRELGKLWRNCASNLPPMLSDFNRES